MNFIQQAKNNIIKLLLLLFLKCTQKSIKKDMVQRIIFSFKIKVDFYYDWKSENFIRTLTTQEKSSIAFYVIKKYDLKCISLNFKSLK